MKVLQSQGDQDARKQTGTIILTFDKIDFKLTLIRKDKEGYFILTKETANKDDTTILNIYVPNTE